MDTKCSKKYTHTETKGAKEGQRRMKEQQKCKNSRYRIGIKSSSRKKNTRMRKNCCTELKCVEKFFDNKPRNILAASICSVKRLFLSSVFSLLGWNCCVL